MAPVVGRAANVVDRARRGHDLLERKAAPSEDEIREALSGNLCRCTGYGRIFEAVRIAAAELRR